MRCSWEQTHEQLRVTSDKAERGAGHEAIGCRTAAQSCSNHRCLHDAQSINLGSVPLQNRVLYENQAQHTNNTLQRREAFNV
jgi:hypothetical protein